jgi:hypothetical protein
MEYNENGNSVHNHKQHNQFPYANFFVGLGTAFSIAVEHRLTLQTVTADRAVAISQKTNQP